MTLNSRLKAIRTPVLGIGLALALSACATPTPGPDGNYVHPFGSSQVTPNPTPYTPALICLARYAHAHNLPAPHVAVGPIRDMTGKLDDNGGRTITQGAMLMAITALGKAGIPVVERYETDVPKLEYDLRNNDLVGDGPTDANGRRDYRPIYPGQVTGSDYFITGGITELNTNIRTANAGVTWTRKSGGAVANPTVGSYVMNVALDLRIISSTSLDVVDMISYQKQIVGRQVGAGVFAFFGDNVINVNDGQSGEEPMALAVRSLVERAVLEFAAGLYGLQGPGGCLDPANDPLRPDRLANIPSYESTPAVQ